MSLTVCLRQERYICYGKPCLENLKRNDKIVFHQNITHNLNKMAEAVSEKFYKAIWRPEEISCKQAKDIIEIIKSGLMLLTLNPTKFKKLDPENGWGSYDGFLPWIASYLDACEKYPEAIIKVSR
jgi:hypothetical protein